MRLLLRCLWSVLCLVAFGWAAHLMHTTTLWWEGLFWIAAALGWLCWLMDPPRFITGEP